MVEQTAVEWLIEKLDNNLDINHSWRSRQYIEQAKQMEKEQILNAFQESRLTHPIIGFKHKTFLEYYNETYGK